MRPCPPEITWRELDKRLFSRRDNGFHNFGDNLDRWLYWELTGKFLPDRTYLMAGSVAKRSGDMIVWGSGFGSLTDKCGKPKKVCAVRGKLTRERYLRQGYDCPEVYGDPALLLPRVFRPTELPRATQRIGFVPHKRDNRIFPWAKLIHPEQNHPKEYVTKMLMCDMIASSSLHGLITADTYGIPNVWVGFEDRKRGLGSGYDYYKWLDYYSAIDLEYQPSPMTELEVQRRATVHPTPDLNTLMSSCPFA